MKHREVLVNAIQAAERNTRMAFSWCDRARNVQIDLLADVESTDLNCQRNVQSNKAQTYFNTLKLKTALRYIMAAHKIEDGSPIAVRMDFAKIPDYADWWDAAFHIYSQVFRGQDSWEDDINAT